MLGKDEAVPPRNVRDFQLIFALIRDGSALA